MADLTTLFIGAVIAIVSSVVTYWVNYLLKIREQKIIRDFDVREKGRDFFHKTYGIVASLGDLVTPFADKANPNKAMVSTERGYVLLPKDEIIRRYKEAYDKYSIVWYAARGNGLELFLTKAHATAWGKFWGYAGYFYDNTDWENNEEAIKKFKAISLLFCDEMDDLMGLCQNKSRIPKWLNIKNWNMILKGKKLTDNNKKPQTLKEYTVNSKDVETTRVGKDAIVPTEFVGEFRKGLVTGSSVQTTRNEIEQSKKPK